MSSPLEMVYTDAQGRELGFVQLLDFDLEDGSSFDFEATVPYSFDIREGSTMYIDGTEWGGIVDGTRDDTTTRRPTLTALGKTWRGVMNETWISSGDGYFSFVGDANAALAAAMANTELDYLFDVEQAPAGADVDFTFPRFGNLLSGIEGMLASIGHVMHIEQRPGFRPCLSSIPRRTYNTGDFSSGFRYVAEYKLAYNHMFVLGSGEDDERLTLHLFMDEGGNVSDVQTIFGRRHRMYKYEISNVHSIEEMREKGAAKLLELQNEQSLKVLVPAGVQCNMGDMVSVESEPCGMSATAPIDRIVVKMNAHGHADVQYSVTDIEKLRLIRKEAV